jgi:hypothetical protein
MIHEAPRVRKLREAARVDLRREIKPGLAVGWRAVLAAARSDRLPVRARGPYIAGDSICVLCLHACSECSTQKAEIDSSNFNPEKSTGAIVGQQFRAPPIPLKSIAAVRSANLANRPRRNPL